MKKTFMFVLALTAIMLAATVAGCGDSSSSTTDGGKLDQATYDRVNKGMSADAVRSLAGEPQKKEEQTTMGEHTMGDMVMEGEMTTEYWYYQGDKGWVRIEIAGGQVTGKSGY